MTVDNTQNTTLPPVTTWWNPMTWFQGQTGSPTVPPANMDPAMLQYYLSQQQNASNLFNGTQYGVPQNNFWYPPTTGQPDQSFMMQIFYRMLQTFPFLGQYFGSTSGGTFTDPSKVYIQPDSSGKIVVKGTEGADTITFGQDSATPFGPGDYFVVVNGQKQYIKAEDISKVEVYALGGNDTIDASGITADGIKFYGGEGDDTIQGSQGADYIFGGLGKDKLYGNDGNDTFDSSGDEIGNSKQQGDQDEIWGGAGQNNATIDQYSDKTHDIQTINNNNS